MKKTILLILIGVMISGLSGSGYNTMQANEEAVKSAWGDVEAAYGRSLHIYNRRVVLGDVDVLGLSRDDLDIVALDNDRLSIVTDQIPDGSRPPPEALD